MSNTIRQIEKKINWSIGPAPKKKRRTIQWARHFRDPAKRQRELSNKQPRKRKRPNRRKGL